MHKIGLRSFPKICVAFAFPLQHLACSVRLFSYVSLQVFVYLAIPATDLEPTHTQTNRDTLTIPKTHQHAFDNSVCTLLPAYYCVCLCSDKQEGKAISHWGVIKHCLIVSFIFPVLLKLCTTAQIHLGALRSRALSFVAAHGLTSCDVSVSDRIWEAVSSLPDILWQHSSFRSLSSIEY